MTIRRGALADAAALGLSALAGVVTGAQDEIAVIDPERRFVYANPAVCAMFSYTLEQLRGRDFLSSFRTSRVPGPWAGPRPPWRRQQGS